MRDRSRIWRFLALLFAFTLLAAACGGDSDDDESADDVTADEPAEEAEDTEDTTATTAEGTTEEAEEAAESQRTEGGGDGGALEAINNRLQEGDVTPGGRMVIDWASDIGSLDPLASSSFNTHWRVGIVYQRLFAPKVGADTGYAQWVLEPELATGLEFSDDLLTATITLRDDVTWQNVDPVNGRQFVCADVKATFDAVQERGFQAQFLERVTSTECPDDQTVVLNLSGPFAPLENYLGHPQLWIMPQEAFDGGFDPAATAIGTGPFIMTEREQDVSTIYEKNPDFWQTDENGVQLPYLDGIDWFVTSDAEQRWANLRAYEVDLAINGMSPEQKEIMLDQAGDNQYFQFLHAAPALMGLNMEMEPFTDVRVRQAMSLAIDRERMAETVIGGGTYAAPVNVHLAEFTLPEDERRDYYRYDPEEAKALLAEAGYPDGFEATMTYTDRYGTRWNRITEWVAEDLRLIGIDVTLEVLDYSTYFGSRWPDVEYEIQFGPQTPFSEPDEWLRGQYATDGGRNWYNLSDPTLDALLNEQLELVDAAERTEKILEIQRYIADNMLAPIPVWAQVTDAQYSPRLRNYWRHFSYGMPGIQHVWLDANA